MTETKDWKQHVADWRASGKTAKAYGAEHGLPEARIWTWSGKVLKAERLAIRPDAVRLAHVVRQRPPEEHGAAVTVELHDARIHVRRGIDRATMAAVIEAVDGL